MFAMQGTKLALFLFSNSRSPCCCENEDEKLKLQIFVESLQKIFSQTFVQRPPFKLQTGRYGFKLAVVDRWPIFRGDC